MAQNSSESVRALQREDFSLVQEISVAQLYKILEAGADLVDVREEEERVCGRIPFPNQHWPLSTFGLREREISQQHPTVFYCTTGMRSIKAAEIAENWTSQSLYSLQGGYLSFLKEDKTRKQETT